MNINSKGLGFKKMRKSEAWSNQSTAPYTNIEVEVHSKSDLKWDIT